MIIVKSGAEPQTALFHFSGINHRAFKESDAITIPDDWRPEGWGNPYRVDWPVDGRKIFEQGATAMLGALLKASEEK